MVSQAVYYFSFVQTRDTVDLPHRVAERKLLDILEIFLNKIPRTLTGFLGCLLLLLLLLPFLEAAGLLLEAGEERSHWRLTERRSA